MFLSLSISISLSREWIMLVKVIFYKNYWALIFKDELCDLILFAVPAEFILEGRREKSLGTQTLETDGS